MNGDIQTTPQSLVFATAAKELLSVVFGNKLSFLILRTNPFSNTYSSFSKSLKNIIILSQWIAVALEVPNTTDSTILSIEVLFSHMFTNN